MEELVDWIGGLDGPAPALVLHVGAGSGAVVGRWLSLPAARRPARVVLVEGDLDAARALEREAAGLDWVQVHTAVVAPVAGTLTWHRYSLPAVNGPLDNSGLATYYPRLRLLSSAGVDAVALGTLLRARLSEIPEGGAPAVLVLDVPGQEAALLQSLPDDLLRRFDAIALRGCKESPGRGGMPLDSAVSALQGRLFSLAALESDREPLWPAAWLRFDRVTFELQNLRAALAERDGTIAELTASLDSRGRAAEQHDAQVESLTRERAGLQAQLEQHAAELGKLRLELAGRDARIAGLEEARQRHDGVASELEARIGAHAREGSALQESLRQRTVELDRLRAELAGAVQERDARAGEVQAAAKRTVELQQQADRLTRDLGAALDEAGKLKSQCDDVQKTANEFKRGLGAARTQVAVKQRRIDELELELQQLRRRQGALDDEIARAEGQLDLIKDLLQLAPQSHAA